jgi:hypothetical protein
LLKTQTRKVSPQKLSTSNCPSFVTGTETFTSLARGNNLDITIGADLAFPTFRLLRPFGEIRGTYVAWRDTSLCIGAASIGGRTSREPDPTAENPVMVCLCIPIPFQERCCVLYAVEPEDHPIASRKRENDKEN